MHLIRMRDDTPLNLETDEEMEEDFGEGDILIARVYHWSDGLELGSWLPIEQDVLTRLLESLDDILNGEDFQSHDFEGPNQNLKVYGNELVRQVFYPDEEED